MARIHRDRGRVAVMLGIGIVLAVRLPASESLILQSPRPRGQERVGASPDRPSILLAQKATAKKKGVARKKAAPAEAAATPTPEKAAAAASDPGPKFARDIAPILVGNCIGCHNPERRRGKFDLTTFEKLMAGSDVEKVIVPGKPDESHLVLRLRGEETPKMPQGNNNLSEEAIAKIESWVKAGAKLDAEIDPKAPLKSYAPTPEQLRAAELNKLSPEQRDKMVETVALQRWKQASPKSTPEITPSTHFLLFSRLPKDRAVAVTKSMETAYTQLRTLLSSPGAPALDWAEKTSLFVFNDARSFVEFVRSLENREIESNETGTANFGTKEPYVAVIDPLGGREEPRPSVATRRSTRSRRGDDDAGSTERSVAGLLAEQMALGVLKTEKNTPTWLGLGIGAYFAAALDPRSTYVQRLRGTAVSQAQQGWTSRANDALGGQLRSDDTRAIGYAIVDWMAHDPQARRLFPAFVRRMIAEGGPKLDDVLQEVFGARRQDLLSSSEAWVTHYGTAR